jgi:farnesyl-diphosphate farnesyltransferase
MALTTGGSQEHLGGPVLRSVSRSFYISVRLLPRRLREPVGLAYLLARATDTLADTVHVPAELRRRALHALAAAIQGNGATEVLRDLQQSFAPLQKNEAERKLIELVPQCLEELARLTQDDREDVRVVLGKIARAQEMDIDRFSGTTAPQALASVADLEEYTYLIAGCVGEFWTQLCFRHLADFSESPREEMLNLGRQYGRGLQLINILRDTGGDLQAGRCYFPADELRAVGLEPSQILAQPERFEPVYKKWQNEAERGLRAGMQYVTAIHNRRVRAATALPALIGARTLALLRSAGVGAFREKIKVPRAEVRGMIASVALTLGSRRALENMFRKNSR